MVQVELGKKGEEVKLHFLPLRGIQDVRRVKGSLEEICPAVGQSCDDFVSVTVTDNQEPYDLRERVERSYPHLLELRVDNERTRRQLSQAEEEIPALKPMDAFEQFYQAVCGRGLDPGEKEVLGEILTEWKEEST